MEEYSELMGTRVIHKQFNLNLPMASSDFCLCVKESTRMQACQKSISSDLLGPGFVPSMTHSFWCGGPGVYKIKQVLRILR